MAVPARPWRVAAGGIVLDIRLTPKSSADRIDGAKALSDGRVVLAARVRALPDKGKANAALVKLVAGWLGWPAGRIALVSGAASRLKRVRVEGDPAELARIAEARMKDVAN
ncbi:MAG: DUF167 family protein [Rhizobiaceae bacterium]